MDVREVALAFLRNAGPSVPVQLSKPLGMDSMLAGAVLSDLAEKKQVIISHFKLGSSPLYYLPGQEEQLLKFVASLPEKDRQSVELLRQQGVMRDKELQPLLRISLRQCKDFALPLDVTFKNEKEIFWKWYLMKDDEAEKRIHAVLVPVQEDKPVPKHELKQELKPESKQETLPVDNAAKALKQDKPAEPLQKTAFESAVRDFLSSNKVRILQEITKKRTELELIVRIPTPVGDLTYYCRAKDKKTVNDADISSAFVQGQLRKLPVLVLSTGELAKKAAELVSRELHAVAFKRL